jgi:hypothetical protein
MIMHRLTSIAGESEARSRWAVRHRGWQKQLENVRAGFVGAWHREQVRMPVRRIVRPLTEATECSDMQGWRKSAAAKQAGGARKGRRAQMATLTR